jgi:hypothetical protein
MATITAPNRSIVGGVFIIGGALQVLGAILGFANVGNAGGFYLLSNLVLGIGFVLLLVWFAATLVARIGYLIAAIGWLLLAVSGLISVPFLSEAATLIAIVGSVFAGVIVIMARPFGGRTSIYADTIFFVAMLVGALELLLSQNGNVPNVIRALTVVLFGALVVVAGILILGKRISRPTISTGS